jgi:hypothetical protein
MYTTSLHPFDERYQHIVNLTSDILQLAMATLATTFGLPFLLTRGGGSKQTTTPPINAKSKDEEKFIQ